HFLRSAGEFSTEKRPVISLRESLNRGLASADAHMPHNQYTLNRGVQDVSYLSGKRIDGPLSGAPMDRVSEPAARYSRVFPVILRDTAANPHYDDQRSGDRETTRLKADDVRNRSRNNFDRLFRGTPAAALIELAATGDIPCQGFSSGCQSGGDSGT